MFQTTKQSSIGWVDVPLTHLDDPIFRDDSHAFVQGLWAPHAT